MRIKLLFRTAVAALVLVAAGAVASAQTVTITGKVTMKQADGTSVPVQAAVVDLYRTDISQKFQVKTNKKGEYTHAGIPIGGIFTVAISAPGATPTYVAGLPLSRQTNNDFTLSPGDGSRLTLEQIKAGSTAATGSTVGASAKENADAKAAREAHEKEVARVTAANAKTEESNSIVQRTFNAGNEAFSAKKYDEAVTLYNEGIAAQPDQAVLHLNKSIALRMRAVDKFNAGAKAKDKAQLDAAKADFKEAAESADKAVQHYRAQGSTNAGGPSAAGSAAAGGQNELMNYLSARMESYRLALQTNAGVMPDQAVPAMEEYIAAETDAVKKAKAEAGLGQALFLSGKIDESIAAYRKVLAANPANLDAMFGLGIALASDPNGAHTAEARDVLKDFAGKAPATDGRKADAEAAVAALDESLKPKPAAGKSDASTGGRKRRP